MYFRCFLFNVALNIFVSLFLKKGGIVVKGREGRMRIAQKLKRGCDAKGFGTIVLCDASSSSPPLPSSPLILSYLELRRCCLIFCSCCTLMFSSLTGLGMKPTSHPSLTRRPIHQSLLYFWSGEDSVQSMKHIQQAVWEKERRTFFT